MKKIYKLKMSTTDTMTITATSWLPFDTLQTWLDTPCLHDITFYLYLLATAAGLLWMGVLLFCSSQRFLAAWMITLLIIMMVAWFIIAGHLSSSLIVKTTGYIWIGVLAASFLSTFYAMYCAYSSSQYHYNQQQQSSVWTSPMPLSSRS
jgi:hypothetical protein